MLCLSVVVCVCVYASVSVNVVFCLCCGDLNFSQQFVLPGGFRLCECVSFQGNVIPSVSK